jgi:hypothetical protein
MKTHTNIEAGEKLDWRKALGAPCSKMSIAVARILAHNAEKWTTCAVGCQCSAIPRRDNGAPLDYALRVQGSEFYRRVSDMRSNIESSRALLANFARWRALRTLRKIEKRSAVLIEAEEAKSNEYLRHTW